MLPPIAAIHCRCASFRLLPPPPTPLPLISAIIYFRLPFRYRFSLSFSRFSPPLLPMADAFAFRRHTLIIALIFHYYAAIFIAC